MREVGWYDYPQYFDMVFRDETPLEVDFFQQAFTRFATGEVHRLYEPGCGSGRLIVAMAALGYEVTGLDLSPRMLSYVKAKLRRRGLSAKLEHGDMVTYCEPESFDAAFCTFNTFRHLMDDASALGHLRAVASSLRSGGIYILGFHMIPLDAFEYEVERWKAKHAGTSVTTTLSVVDFCRKKRAEQVRIVLTAKSATKAIRCRTEFPLRLYTHTQVKKLFAQVPEFELQAVYDFNYEIDEPLKLDAELADSVFVLKKR